jgi:hypothetical protein
MDASPSTTQVGVSYSPGTYRFALLCLLCLLCPSLADGPVTKPGAGCKAPNLLLRRS